LLTQFGATSSTLEATKPGRKSTSVVLILSFSANSSFTTLDLGPTRINFNLGTPRSEIPSHFPQSTTAPVMIRLQTQQKMKVPSNKLPNSVLHSFGEVHKLPTSVLHSFGVVNNLQLNETQSLTCIKMIQEMLTNNK